MEEMHRAGSWGGGGQHSFHVLSSWYVGVSPSQHISVFTNQEDPLSFSVQSFYMGFHYIGVIE